LRGYGLRVRGNTFLYNTMISRRDNDPFVFDLGFIAALYASNLAGDFFESPQAPRRFR